MIPTAFLGFEVFHTTVLFCFFLFPDQHILCYNGSVFSLSPFTTYKHEDAVVRGLLANVLPCLRGLWLALGLRVERQGLWGGWGVL